MQADITPPIPSNPTTIGEELTAYNRFTSFNLFLFSRQENDQSLLLLYKSSDFPAYTHLSGRFSPHDPAISFTIAREIITRTCGLLHSENFKHFTAKNTKIQKPLHLMKMHYA